MTVDNLRACWDLLGDLQRHYSPGSDSHDNLRDVRMLLESEARIIGGKPEEWITRQSKCVGESAPA